MVITLLELLFTLAENNLDGSDFAVNNLKS